MCVKLNGHPYFEGPLSLRCSPEMAFCPGYTPWLSLAASRTTASSHQQTIYLFSADLIFEPWTIRDIFKSSCLNLMTCYARWQPGMVWLHYNDCITSILHLWIFFWSAASIASSVDISFVLKFLVVLMNFNSKKKYFCCSREHILYCGEQLLC